MKSVGASNRALDRRRFITRGLAGLGALSLGGCDRLSESPRFMDLIGSAENLTRGLQRLLIGNALAPEFAEADISPAFRANGTTDPVDKAYRALAKDGFKQWALAVDGLVERPGKFSLTDLRAMPARTQITRHDCVEGWSCIGKWTGVPLSALLERVGVKPQAKFVVFHCADDMNAQDAADEEGEEADEDDEEEDSDDDSNAGQAGGGGPPSPLTEEGKVARYYESVDFVDALHPQTILAYDMSGQPLGVPHGAPLRLRVERQLGYKMAKYLMRIEVAESLAGISGGKGGYWEDRGYEWYAGI